jgi:hypothetical protein
MFLRQQRGKFLMPEVDLFFLGQRTHVSNYGRFFLHEGVNLRGESNDPRSVAADIGVVPAAQGLDVDQQPSLNLVVALGCTDPHIHATYDRNHRAGVRRASKSECSPPWR